MKSREWVSTPDAPHKTFTSVTPLPAALAVVKRDKGPQHCRAHFACFRSQGREEIARESQKMGTRQSRKYYETKYSSDSTQKVKTSRETKLVVIVAALCASLSRLNSVPGVLTAHPRHHNLQFCSGSTSLDIRVCYSNGASEIM
ncbi:hypothetical protein J6590_005868 [Homalodisca vitripennis]|nr:hypothetical protein J6590_005868 [Homalodisca vitripennis]